MAIGHEKPGRAKASQSDSRLFDSSEKNKVRERCLELYPDREELYEMIYESRFQRLADRFPREDEAM